MMEEVKPDYMKCGNCDRYPCVKERVLLITDSCHFPDDFVLKRNISRFMIEDSNKINCGKIASEIMQDFYFICARDNEELFYYDPEVFEDGIYHTGAENLIKAAVKQKLGEAATEHISNEVIFHIQASTYINRDEINKEKKLIHLENGIFNLDTMELQRHDHTIISTVKLPVKYDPLADCIFIKKFISEVVGPEDIPIIQELFGYVLLKDYPIQKAFVFLGDGANGKSTLLRLFEAFIGKENVSGVALQDIDSNRFAGASLYGKLANIFADLPDRALYQTGKFKMLTGGDMFSAERKFKEAFNFLNYAKLIYSANKLPEARDDTSAFFRRWIMINFPNVFEADKCDKHILEKITIELEISGLFNWAIEGLKRLLERGEFSNSKTTEQLRDQYERLSSPLAAFVKDRIEVASEGYITKDDFFSEFVKYCKDKGLPIKAKNVISREMPMHLPFVSSGRKSINGVQVHSWFGIKFTDLTNSQDSQVSQANSLFKSSQRIDMYSI